MSPSKPQKTVPFTVKDRVINVLLSLVFFGLGAGMWIRPALMILDADDHASGRGGRRVEGWLRLLDFVWSRPVGVFMILIGLLLIWGAMVNKTKTVDVEEPRASMG